MLQHAITLITPLESNLKLYTYQHSPTKKIGNSLVKNHQGAEKWARKMGAKLSLMLINKVSITVVLQISYGKFS